MVTEMGLDEGVLAWRLALVRDGRRGGWPSRLQLPGLASRRLHVGCGCERPQDNEEIRFRIWCFEAEPAGRSAECWPLDLWIDDAARVVWLVGLLPPSSAQQHQSP